MTAALGPLLCHLDQKAELEARNGVDQLDYITELVAYGATELRESQILELHVIAVRDIYPCTGKYRDALKKVSIQNSGHSLPESALVTTFVRDAVDRINASRGKRSAVERAAYALWRFNWIHPFSGGNGRTSRSIAYFIVCQDAGRMLPGVPSMPGLIYSHRDEYIEALRAVDASVDDHPADDAFEGDVTAIAEFLTKMLMKQFANAIDALSGRGVKQ